MPELHGTIDKDLNIWTTEKIIAFKSKKLVKSLSVTYMIGNLQKKAKGIVIGALQNSSVQLLQDCTTTNSMYEIVINLLPWNIDQKTRFETAFVQSADKQK